MSSIRVFVALVVFLVTAACSGCVSPSRTIIRTPDAPTSPFYSQAVRVGSTLYVTGIASRDPKTSQPVGTRSAWKMCGLLSQLQPSARSRE